MILGIDSSSNTASVCICDSEKVVADLFLNCGLTHSQTLMPMVKNALSLAQNPTIDEVVVTAGPGSFTGIRIAISGAKGYAMAENLPCVSVSTLEALAYNCINVKNNTTICTMMDARLKRAYVAFFKLENAVITRISEDDCLEFSKIYDKLNDVSGDILIVGDCTKIFTNNYNEYEKCLDNSLNDIKSYSAILASKNKEKVTADSLQPVYLQMPQAERERLDKLMKGK